jgi:hypothetical protein
VKDKNNANLFIAKRNGFAEFDAILAASAPLKKHAVSKSGTGFTQAKKNRDELDTEIKKIRKIPVKKNNINAKNQKSLEDPATRCSNIVSEFGTRMKIAHLPRARQFLVVNLGARATVKFKAEPAKFEEKTALYRKQFLANMLEQLRDQERGIRKLSIDEWLAQRSLFTMDEKAFLALDNSSRRAVLGKLHERAVKARPLRRKRRR